MQKVLTASSCGTVCDNTRWLFLENSAFKQFKRNLYYPFAAENIVHMCGFVTVARNTSY